MCIRDRSRHEPKIVTHGSDQQMLQHLLSIEQLPCVAGCRKGNGDVENERAEEHVKKQKNVCVGD